MLFSGFDSFKSSQVQAGFLVMSDTATPSGIAVFVQLVPKPGVGIEGQTVYKLKLYRFIMVVLIIQ